MHAQCSQSEVLEQAAISEGEDECREVNRHRNCPTYDGSGGEEENAELADNHGDCNGELYAGRKQVLAEEDRARKGEDREHCFEDVIDGFQSPDRQHDDQDPRDEFAHVAGQHRSKRDCAREQQARRRDDQAEDHHDRAKELVVVAALLVEE